LLADVEESAFDQVVAVDLKGVFLAMKYEIQHMLKAGGGAIVNNASIAGMIAEAGISSYVAAKHAVIGLSRAAAIEYASQGIRINALAPGLVETGMTKHWFADDKIRASLVGRHRSAAPRNLRDSGDGAVPLLGFSFFCRRSGFRRGWRIHRSLTQINARSMAWD